MSEIINFILQEAFFILKSLIFWSWMATGLVSGYLFSVMFARVFIKSTISPYHAAMRALIFGYIFSAAIFAVIMFFLWMPSYVLVGLVSIILFFIPATLSQLLRREIAQG